MSSLDIILAAAGGSEVPIVRSTITNVTSGSGTLNPPAGAVYMRVAAIGGGGGGHYDNTVYGLGGAGGGCAATKIVPAVAITYSVGAGGTTGSYAGSPVVKGGNGGNTTASFGSYSLIGGGGQGSNRAAPQGGSGSGGDYNYTGGSASYDWGGGAAGPNGNGGTANGGYNYPGRGEYLNDGWGPGGGESGRNNYSGGGGVGKNGSLRSYSTSSNVNGTGYMVAVSDKFGDSAPIYYSNTAETSTKYTYGGAGGGGAGGRASQSTDPYSVGGAGVLVVEYFYTS